MVSVVRMTEERIVPGREARVEANVEQVGDDRGGVGRVIERIGAGRWWRFGVFLDP
jgi:hypothetical protein